jgi:hypothetical protein
MIDNVKTKAALSSVDMDYVLTLMNVPIEALYEERSVTDKAISAFVINLNNRGMIFPYDSCERLSSHRFIAIINHIVYHIDTATHQAALNHINKLKQRSLDVGQALQLIKKRNDERLFRGLLSDKVEY